MLAMYSKSKDQAGELKAIKEKPRSGMMGNGINKRELKIDILIVKGS